MRFQPMIGPLLAGLVLVAPTPASLSPPPRAEPEPLKVTVAFQGLAGEQAPQVERELHALEAGPQGKRVKILDQVVLDLEKGQVELSVAAGQELSFAGVERILTGGKARVLREKLRVGDARLAIEGSGDDELVATLRQALSAGGLFKSVEIKRQEEPALILAEVRGGSDKASYDAVAKVIQGVSESLRLKDVLWTAPVRG